MARQDPLLEADVSRDVHRSDEHDPCYNACSSLPSLLFVRRLSMLLDPLTARIKPPPHTSAYTPSDQATQGKQLNMSRMIQMHSVAPSTICWTTMAPLHFACPGVVRRRPYSRDHIIRREVFRRLKGLLHLQASYHAVNLDLVMMVHEQLPMATNMACS